DVVPKFSQWQKEGDLGRRKITQFTRYGTILIAIFQSVAMSMGFNKMMPGLVINPSFTTYAIIAITLTAGTAFLMWVGEEITEKGIGNGISILIFAGIVAAIPGGVKSIYASEFFGAEDQVFINVLKILGILVAIILLVVGVIYVLQAMRKVPVQYAKRVVGRTVYGGQSTH
ncbi:MAG TPA: preprotein translocase subunit SecY, partial [Paenibacillaceae bacterium]|nr:preprotein translocase subunit SecY [Paenibacillaceae bacterium]